MFDELDNANVGVGRTILESTNEILLLLLGMTAVDIPAEHLVNC